MIDLPLDIIAHQLDRLLLPALLLLALWLGRRAALRGGGAGLALSTRLAQGLLLVAALWWLWLALTAFIGIPRDQWIGPFDRLLQTLALALVAWLLLDGGQAGLGRRGRLGLALAFGGLLPLYLGWAPRWARAMQAAGASSLPMGTARIWDAWQALLALGLTGFLLPGRRGGRAWPLGVLGCLVTASLLDLWQAPEAATAYAPVWGRLGLLGIGVGLAAQALQRNLELGLTGGGKAPPRTPPVMEGTPPPAPFVAPSQGQRDQALARSVAEQATQIGRLADALAALGTRLDRLERAARPDEATLRRLRDYQESLEQLPVGLLLTDARGRLSFANGAATALLGQEPRTGQALAEALGAGEPVQAALREVLRDGRARLTGLSAGGASAEIDLVLHAFRDPEGGIRALLALLARPAAALDPAGLALVPELLEAIRAPITSIKGYSHLIQGGQTMLTGQGQVERYLERIDANLSMVKVMLRNLGKVLALEPATAAAGEEPPLNVADSLAAACERAGALLHDKGLSIVPAALPLPSLRLDPAILDLVLDNLLLHAVHRSPLGGDIQLKAHLAEEGLVLAVLDRGRPREETGAPPEPAPRLDDPATPTELKVAFYLSRRAEGRVWLEQAEEGLWTCAVLACSTAPRVPAAGWAAPLHAVPELAASGRARSPVG